VQSADLGCDGRDAGLRAQELFRECSVYCELISAPAQLPRILEIAMREPATS
jgi:thiamine pyrophosphate-dependent acetolactate synthase large subunit-like protein